MLSSTAVAVVSSGGGGGGDEQQSVDSAGVDPSSSAGKTRVYAKRWVILGLFCALSMTNAFQWIEYSIVTPAITRFYGVPDEAVDWTSMIYMLGYVPFVFPATWLLDRYGLRLSALLGAFGTCVGAWVKCASASPERFAVTFLGQTIVGCSQVFILGIPPRLAAVWFGPDQVSTATAIGVFGNQVGIAIGFYVPAAIIRNATLPDLIGSDLQVLFFSTAGVASLVFVLIFFIFVDAPPVPPSQAQLAAIAATIEKNYLHSLLNLVRNTNYLLLVTTYGLNVGVFYGVSTLLSQTLEGFFPGRGSFFGVIGFAIVIAGMFGSVACGFVLDKTHHFKLTTVVVYLCSVAGMVAYTAGLYMFDEIWVMFAIAAFLGFFMTGYLPVGFEFGAELTYPCSEGTQSGMLNASAQVFGIALVLGMGALLRNTGPLACNVTMTAVLLLGTVLTVFIKSDLRRQKANKASAITPATNHESGKFISAGDGLRAGTVKY